MRKIGEKHLEEILPVHRPPEIRQVERYNGKTWIPTQCTRDGCDVVKSLTVSYIRFLAKSGAQYVCPSCKETGKAEMQQALINLARRKGLIA